MSHRLLFVEDEKSAINLFKDALKDWIDANADNVFEVVIVDNYGEALQLLSEGRFDGALLDLKLPGGAGRLGGEELAELCVHEYGMPAAIISGNPADRDRSRGHGMLAEFNKGDTDSYERAINWFGGLWHMMKVLRGTRDSIRRLGATVFAQQVWPRWSSYEQLEGLGDEQLIGIVTRQYTSHIADALGIDSDSNVQWHPFENYVSPALQEKKAHTGDIFRLGGGLWIVLTPPCDMVTEKASAVLLAKCASEPDPGVWKERLSDQKSEVARRRESAERFFRDLVNQREPAKHFLPPLELGQPLMVDFKQLMTVPLRELQSNLENRIASVSSPFLANLTQRFGAYISRVGQPNLDANHFG